MLKCVYVTCAWWRFCDRNEGGSKLSTLWRWSVKVDEWAYVTECAPEMQKAVKRSHARRSPLSTVFRWTDNALPPVRRYRQRAAKEKV